MILQAQHLQQDGVSKYNSKKGCQNNDFDANCGALKQLLILSFNIFRKKQLSVK